METGAAKTPVVAVAAPRERALAQTFVRAHLDRLPARTALVHGREPMRLHVEGCPLVGPVARRALEALPRGGRRLGARLVERALVRWLRREGVDAMLAEFGPTGIRMAPACARSGVPLVVHFHGYDAHRERFADAYTDLFVSAAAIVAVSRPMRERLEQLGAAPEKLHVVPCGADLALLPEAKPAYTPPNFVSVGRFVHKKSPHRTLRAFAKLLALRPSVRLDMVGAGPLLPSCQRLASELGIAHAVTFHGKLSQEEVMGVLALARGFVHHAVRATNGDCEGTPVALLEASGAGLPVVSTRHGGVPDAVVEGGTGFLVDEGDVDGMAAHLLRLTDDPQLAGRLGASGRAFVARDHALERRIGELWAVIESTFTWARQDSNP